ncbi:MAG TPA: hypothetical protein VFT71_06775 [Candidatus Nitrosocosmicus sp.]|nr:hypothetical protein [Candidatus Nitrosocosmicus sp.]
MEKIQIIRNLEALFQVCFSKEQDFLRVGGKQNDARVTFHKHLINTLNSSIHLMIFSDTTLLTEDWWLKKLPKYKINKRMFSASVQESRQIEVGHIDHYLLFSYFNFIFHTFETSFRIICENCFNDEYYIIKQNGEREKRDIKNLCEVILKKLNLFDNDRESFLEIVIKFRDSLYNNGVFINEKQESRPLYKWKHNSYVFNYAEQIPLENKSDLWIEYFRFTREFISIFTDVINHPTVKKYRFIEDITEPG